MRDFVARTDVVAYNMGMQKSLPLVQLRNLVFLALLPVASGCVATALGVAVAGAAGAVLYAKNEAVMKYSAPLAKTWDATMAAMRESGLDVGDTSRRPNATEGRIDAGDTVARVESIPGNLTQVRVRVGTIRTDDNKRRAKLILERIKNKLGL